MKRKISSLIIFLIFVLSAIVSLSLNHRKALAVDVQMVKNAPDFTLNDLNGNPFSLSDLKGKIVLLDFWATWCPFCRESIPILQSLYNDYKDKGFEVVGIALEYDGGRVLRRFAEEENIPYTLLIGNEKLATKYSAYGVPTRFLINREGKIVKKFIGYQDKEIFVAAIKQFL